MTSSLPPETPTRALLKRIHRRSSVLPSTALNVLPDHSLSLLGPREDVSNEFSHLADEATPNVGRDDTRFEDDPPKDTPTEDGGRRDAKHEDEQTRQLQSQIEVLRRQKQGGALGLKKNKRRSSQGVTWDAARRLEREFEAQERILKGLQRDNERRTIECEHLHRKLRAMSDFLRQHHGDDWPTSVFGGRSGLSSAHPSYDQHEDPQLKRSTTATSPTISLRSAEPRERNSSPDASDTSGMSTPFSGRILPWTDLDKPSALTNLPPKETDTVSHTGTGRKQAGRGEDEDNAGSTTTRWTDAEASFNSAYIDFSLPDSATPKCEAALSVESDDASFTCPTLESERNHKCPGSYATEQSLTTNGSIGRVTPTSATRSKGKDAYDISQILSSDSLQCFSEAPSHDPDQLGMTTALLSSDSLRDHLESIRLLLDGFARRCARRETELKEMEDRARLELRRGSEMLSAAAVGIKKEVGAD